VSDDAVERAAVQQMPTEALGQAHGKCPFARPTGPVNCNDRCHRAARS
jgi:hypothetical protein